MGDDKRATRWNCARRCGGTSFRSSGTGGEISLIVSPRLGRLRRGAREPVQSRALPPERGPSGGGAAIAGGSLLRPAGAYRTGSTTLCMLPRARAHRGESPRPGKTRAPGRVNAPASLQPFRSTTRSHARPARPRRRKERERAAPLRQSAGGGAPTARDAPPTRWGLSPAAFA